MGSEKRLIVGDTVYIITTFSYDPVIAVIARVHIAYVKHKRFYAYPDLGHMTFSFCEKDLGHGVFLSREDAEAALAKMDGERKDNAD